MRLYFRYLCIHVKSQLQYKLSFLLMTLGQLIASFSAFLGLYFMFSRFNQVDGFTFSEVLLCFSTTLLSFALAECFARGFDMFPRMLSNGQFDRILVRPRGMILQILASQIELSRIGRLIQAVFVFIYAMPRCGVIWSFHKTLTPVSMVLCSTALFSALFVLSASLSFFTTQGLEVMNIFTDGGREFGSYPYSIYGREILKAVTYVIPLALVQYYPFLYLIGRTENRLYMVLPFLSLLFFIPCALVWRLGLRRFKSTGS